MSTVSFAAKPKAEEASVSETSKAATATPTPVIPPGTQVAVRPEQTLARPMAPIDDMAGAWDERKDVKLPRVNLIHKTSKTDLVKQFGIGAFVLSSEVKLSDGETPLPVTALFVIKDYIQKLPFGKPGAVVYKTPEEVRANGGTLDWSREAVAEEIFFDNRAHIELIFAAPDGVDEQGMFPFEFDGKNYVRALLTVSASAYTSVGKDLATLRTQNRVMRNGLRFGKLELTSKEIPHPKNPWLIPVIKYAGENSPEFVQFVENFR